MALRGSCGGEVRDKQIKFGHDCKEQMIQELAVLFKGGRQADI